MPKRIDSTLTIELVIHSITLGYLFKELFEKYAGDFAAKDVNWQVELTTGSNEERSLRMLKLFKRLREVNPEEHAELCGALTIIGIAAGASNIKRFMNNSTNRNAQTRKFFVPDLLNKSTGSNSIEEPTNKAAWFCIKKEVASQWEDVVSMANSEQRSRLSWSTYEISSPTKLNDPERPRLDLFEESLREHFKNKPIEFTVEALPMLHTSKFDRYIVFNNQRPDYDKGR